MRLALSALKSQGLIGSGQGLGTYVRKARPIRVIAMDQDRAAKGDMAVKGARSMHSHADMRDTFEHICKVGDGCVHMSLPHSMLI